MERTERQIARMEAAEGLHGQSYEPSVQGARSDVNRTAATDVRIDFEDRIRRRLEEDYTLIERGCFACYGEDNRGGVDKLLGSATADALWWRYCAGESWVKTSAMVSASAATCRRWCEAAFDLVDSIGESAAISGIGSAES